MNRNNKTIRIAGNTETPCFLALKAKGYEVDILACTLTNEEGTDCSYEYEARKDGWRISATTIFELLALVAMWEVRGENWEASRDEHDQYFNLKDDAPEYDINGNKIKEE